MAVPNLLGASLFAAFAFFKTRRPLAVEVLALPRL